MRRYGARHWAVLAAVALLLCNGAPVFGSEGHTISKVQAHRMGGSRWGANFFPNVLLVTQDGESVRFFDDLIKDKVVLINLIYASCTDSCPLATAQLAKVQQILGDRVGRDVFMYSLSIDPVHDTPQALKNYAKKFHVKPGWLFLTGSAADIKLLRVKLGFDFRDMQDPLKDHNMDLLMGNQRTGQWMKHSVMDNPYLVAEQVGTWLTNWEKPSATANANYAKAPQLRVPTMGENLFRTRCAACHTIGGDAHTVGGGEAIEANQKLGPDLEGVTEKRERAWLGRWLTDPAKMLAAKDPFAMALYAEYGGITMPNLRLGQVEVNALIDYMAAESRRAASVKRTRGNEPAGTAISPANGVPVP
jgi:protein SCO1